jgi:NADH-quinone oxidoreductase subunit I
MHDKRKSTIAEAWTIGKAVAQAMRITFINFFRKPVTVHYPTVSRPFPNRFRGLLALTYDPDTGEENCIGCRLCEFICPPAVIKVEMLKAEKRNYAKTFTLELYACEFCELCVQVCPTDAIVMMKSFDLATADRRTMLLDKERLHAIGKQHEASWATGNRLRDMQQPPKKTEDKKTEDKKAEEKKAEEKKTEDKKTEEKKTEDKQSEDKQTEEGKA